MKKKSSVIEEKNMYDLVALIENTALVKSVTEKKGLIDIRTNEIVGSFDNYETLRSLNKKYFFMKKEIYGESTDDSKENIYVRLFDALNEKMVLDNWLMIEEVDSDNLYILQNPITQKYHLLNLSEYRTNLNIIDTEFDEIYFLCHHVYNGTYEYYLSISKNGKKALYSDKEGIISPYEYDDIEKSGDVIIFTQGDRQFFAHYDAINQKSPMFKEIKSDEKDGKMVYCKNDSSIEIYYAKPRYRDISFKKLFTTEICDDIKIIESIKNYSEVLEYIFLAQKNKKFGLLSGVVNKKDELTPLTDIEYDEIKFREFENRNYFLDKDGKKGMFRGASEKNYLIPAKYDKVVPMGNSNYYVVFTDGVCNIINILNQDIAISNCKIIEHIGYSAIYEKDGKKGIFYSSVNLTLYGYDDVHYLGYGYHLIIKNGKKGIVYNAEVILQPIYEYIEVGGNEYNKPLDFLDYAMNLYFSLKKEDGIFDLAKFEKGSYNINNKLKFSKLQGFSDVQFYDTFMVLRDTNNAYIYDYNEKLLKTYSSDVEISVISVKRGAKKIDLYIIDGIYYMHINNNLEVAPIETSTLYMTTYESDSDTIIVNSYNKQMHDEICRQIEEGDEENIDSTLDSIYKKNPQIKEKYPTLIKRLKPNEKK